jgi:hypothetical protein
LFERQSKARIDCLFYLKARSKSTTHDYVSAVTFHHLQTIMEKLSQAHADAFCTLVEAGDSDAVFANSQTKPPSVRRVLAVLAGKGDQEASGQLQEIRAKGRERRKADREKQKGRERQAFISEATKQINETTYALGTSSVSEAAIRGPSGPYGVYIRTRY